MKVFLYEETKTEPIQVFSFFRDDDVWFIVTFNHCSTSTLITKDPPKNKGDELVGLGRRLAIQQIYDPQVAVMQGNIFFSKEFKNLPGKNKIPREHAQKRKITETV